MMKKTAVAAAFGLPLLIASPALASNTGGDSFQANLTPLNDSGVTSTAMVSLDGDSATVTIDSSGLLEGAPHAQHFHFAADSRGECPTPADDENGDGVLTTPEGIPAYGAIVASLTTDGDTSADSGLAVDRFPVGNASYSRTFDLEPGVADSIREGGVAVVVHGVDLDGSGAYDGDVMSELDDSLPREATVPAACGILNASQSGAPSGGVETGAGGTAGVEQTGLIAAGLASVAAAGAVMFRRRKASDTI